MSRVETLNWQLATNSKKGLATSVVLHAFFALALFWSSARYQSSNPFGVRRLGDSTVIEIGIAAPKAKTTKKSQAQEIESEFIESSSFVVKKQKEKKKAVEQQEVQGAEKARFGVKDGALADGRFGDPNGIQASEKEYYLYELRMLLEGRKFYPKLSRYMKESGRVVVRFTVLKDGEVQQVEIAEPSSFERLNKAAEQLVTSLKKFKPLPDEVKTASLRVEVPIEYSLTTAL